MQSVGMMDQEIKKVETTGGMFGLVQEKTFQNVLSYWFSLQVYFKDQWMFNTDFIQKNHPGAVRNWLENLKEYYLKS